MESKIRDGFFIGSKGQDTYFRIWTPSSTPIARVLAIHGLGEHIKRYDHVFKVFADNGILVRGMDWSGMGATVAKQLESKTSGAIKGYAEFETVYNDLEILNHFQVEENEKNVPTFCFGHSMVYFVDIGLKIKGTISQAPALKPGNPLPSWVGIPLKLTYFGVVGRYTDSSKLELSGLSTDLKVIEDYKKDPLNHDRISMQLLSDMVSTSKMLMENASSFKTPLIIYHATKDRLTSVDGSVEFSKVVGSPDKKFKQFEGVEHELHNESSIKDQVIQDYVEWIKSRV